MDWRRRLPRWRLAVTIDSSSSTTDSRRSTSTTIRCCLTRGRGGNFADGYTPGRLQIKIFLVLNLPPASIQLRIETQSRSLLRCHRSPGSMLLDFAPFQQGNRTANLNAGRRIPVFLIPSLSRTVRLNEERTMLQNGRLSAISYQPSVSSALLKRGAQPAVSSPSREPGFGSRFSPFRLRSCILCRYGTSTRMR